MRPAHVLLLAAAAAAPVAAPACQVPVFRYALERWFADPYSVALTCEAEPEDGTPARAAYDFLDERIGLANQEPYIVKAKRDEGGIRWSEAEQLAALGGPPQFHLFYPPDHDSGAPVISVPATPEGAQSLIDSPARRDLIKRIIGGDSAVWIVLEGGDGGEDDAAAAVLADHLKAAQAEIALPAGVVGRNAPKPADPFFDPANILRSEIPLHIAFSILRLDPAAPGEAALVAMLRGIDEDAAAEPGPLAIPVFGRGRALPPLPASKLTAGVVREYCEYICGACSCEVKNQNPGVDLLITADWDALVEGSETIVDKALPPLEGPGALMASAAEPDAAAAASDSGEAEGGGAAPSAPGDPESAATADEEGGYESIATPKMYWSVGIALGVAFLLLVWIGRRMKTEGF